MINLEKIRKSVSPLVLRRPAPAPYLGGGSPNYANNTPIEKPIHIYTNIRFRHNRKPPILLEGL